MFSWPQNKFQDWNRRAAAYAVDQKERWRTRVISQVESTLDRALDAGSTIVKENIKDPLMPQFVQRQVDSVVDFIWPDFKEEVIDMVVSGIRPSKPINHGEPIPCGITYPWDALRAFLLYHLYPFDKTIWGKLRDPIYVLLFLIPLVPLYAIPQIYYLTLWLFIDKQDAYQLVEYILAFKGIQFITLGVISGLVGAIRYYICVNFDVVECQSASPYLKEWDAAVFVGQIVVVWISFLLLYFSHSKGSYYYQAGLIPNNAGKRKCLWSWSTRTDSKQGHALRHLVWYDIIIFLLCGGAVMLACFMSHEWDGWRFRATLYWIRVIYGLLSFPFIIYKIYPLSAVLLHSRPTAYNRWGVTVPWLGPSKEALPPQQPSNDPEAETRRWYDPFRRSPRQDAQPAMDAEELPQEQWMEDNVYSLADDVPPHSEYYMSPPPTTAYY